MTQKKLLPIGIENFAKLRTGNFYYIDKTGLISELLHNWAQVTLFVRPRRFGKSLNMNMLKTFFETGCDPELFKGLKIWEEQELCERYMGRSPVVSLTLKGVDGPNYETARGMLCSEIRDEAARFSFLETSEKLDAKDKEDYRCLLWGEAAERRSYMLTDESLYGSLKTLTRLLAKHYEKEVILLIDEYDVPLDKAYQNGYYDEMTSLIRNVFSQALKTNDYLQFAVLTGCLRISKESIFTGLNNLRVLTVMDRQFDEYFGFTDQEVRDMLAYYDQGDAYDTVKEWYDGYRFGNVHVYCPWDVVNYCSDLRADPNNWPKDYWSNTSGNSIVRQLLQKATASTKKELESLIAGEGISKSIRSELTYRDLDGTVENIWSVLLMTGYLTLKKPAERKLVELVIPNQEIREIFVSQIHEWFEEQTAQDQEKLRRFCNALQEGDFQTVENLFNEYLRRTISIRDTGARKEKKENFYHGIFLGLLGYTEEWSVSSNAEAGEGYCDIRIEDEKHRIGIIIEMKYAQDGDLEKACRTAVKQIEDRNYTDTFLDDGMEKIRKYGIACYKKRCKVMLDEAE